MRAQRLTLAILAILVLVILPATIQAQTSRVVATYGVWDLRRNADPMTDADRSSIRVGGEDGAGSLLIRCMDDGVNVMYVWDTYLYDDSDAQIPVEIRFDNEPVIGPQWWDVSSNNKGAFSPMDRVRSFITAAGSASTVTLRVRDVKDNERIVHTFSLTGFGEALNSLECARGRW